MRIDLTLLGADGSARDVAVEAPGSTSVAELAKALGTEISALTGGAGSPATELAATGLRSGAIVPVPRGPRSFPSLALTVTLGEAAGRGVPLRHGRMVVGRSPDCGLVLADALVSRRHAEISVAGGVVSVRDLGSAHGTWLDQRRIDGAPVVLPPEQPLRVGNAELVVREGPEPSGAHRRTADGRILIRRGFPVPLPDPPEEISVPQLSPEQPRPSLSFGAVLAAFGGVGLAAALASPLYLAVSAISPAALIAEAGAGRLRGRRERRRAAERIARAARREEERLVGARALERAKLRHQGPDPAELARTAAAGGGRLWERRPGDPDLLAVRVGLAATASRVRVRRDDRLDPPADLGDLPRRIDLGAGPLEITGPRDAARALARWLVVQLGVLVSPADLQLAILCAPQAAACWRWARWLPHLRTVAVTEDEVLDAAALLARTGSPAQTVVVADDIPGRVAAALSRLCNERGFGLILVSPAGKGLSGRCATIADVGTGRLLPHAGEPVALRPDAVAAALAESTARDLAPLDVDHDLAAALPARWSLRTALGLDRLDPAAIALRWQRSGGRLRTPIGTNGTRPVLLDLQRDGPHALVAGTTGSGKSELLRSLVLGLAASVAPTELQMLLFDFKGGASFAELARLPHTVAVLTDLDGSGAARALRSLDSELQRRERLLAAAGAPDLERYRPGGDAPRPPRLVVVIDEFAALAAGDERLLPALVSVAQRGRSLGLHLVLATQRPGACVSADVRANTNVRIALRTVSAAESIDVIDVPDAGGLDARRPGLALLRAGADPVLFQTAGAGVRPDGGEPAGLTVTALDDWRRPAAATARHQDPDGVVEEFVEAVRAAAPAGAARARLWLAPLPSALRVIALPAVCEPWRVPWALVDLPAEQRQETLSLDLRAGGGVLLTGGPGSGRSTALAALAVTAAERLGSRFHLHVVDPAGRLAGLARLPAAGTVAVGAAAVETVSLLLTALREEVDRRAGAPPTPDTAGAEPAGPPAVLLLVDGWEDLCAATESFDAGRCADNLLELMRRSSSVAVTVVLAGDRASLAGRVTGAATRRFVLPLADRADYAAAGVPVSALPVEPPPGRAVRVPDGAAVQFAFAGPAPDRWGEAVDRLASEPKRADPRDAGPVRIRELPSTLRLAQIDAAARRGAAPGRLPFVVGVGGRTATPLVPDLAGGARALLVAGPARSGRSTVLVSALIQLADAGGIGAAVIAPPRSPLRRLADRRGLTVSVDAEVPGGATPQLILVDDCDHLTGSAAEAWLLDRLADPDRPVTIIASVRSDQLALSYRGLAAELRSFGSALLLAPTGADAELFGIALPRRPRAPVPGRGVLVADPAWGLPEPAPRVQVAVP